MPTQITGSGATSARGSGGGGRWVVGGRVTWAAYPAAKQIVRYANDVLADLDSTAAGGAVPAVDPGTAEPSLANRLRLAVVRLNRRLRAQSTDRAVTLTQLSALSCLHKCGPLTPGELAAKERVQPPSMTRVIAALEERGLVSRRPHPSDGRQAIVAVTAEGADYLNAEAAARERWLDQRLTELTDDERELLARCVELIDRMAGS